ncbi:hypothetical protein P43SY_001449 [Pythium insidiosum]|uniref:Tetratricopeptide repeat protein n=1 Tax=Pythium insidiosum TaxID=114742 RepID=A0AAD5Q919_PYTIN|nr:hypothetical protein P43SY_001449 [Pythium insidiosum]
MHDAVEDHDAGSTALWHGRLAALLAANKRYAKARRHYVAALALLSPDSDQITSTARRRLVTSLRCGLARVLVRLDERSQAIDMYMQALSEDGRCVAALVDISAQLLVDGQLTSALEHCNRALEIAPHTKEAHYNRNVILRRLGRQSEAIDCYWDLLQAQTTIARPLSLGEHERVSSSEALSPALGKQSAAEPLMVSVVCVKWGTKYGVDYVDKLYRGVMRHVDSSRVGVRFVCLTDDAAGIDASGDITCIRLEGNWRGWWNKAELFSPAVAATLERYCVYIDLDTVIVGDLTELFLALAYRLDVTRVFMLRTDAMANEQRLGGYNSSIIAWQNESTNQSEQGGLSAVYELLVEHFDTITSYIYKLDHWFEMMLPAITFVEDLAPGGIVEYQSLEAREMALPPAARVVCFPLRPKPHEATASWIPDHWR